MASASLVRRSFTSHSATTFFVRRLS